MTSAAPAPGVGTDDLVAALSRKIAALLRRLLSPGGRCALLDFPNYLNVGDNAIWLGQRCALNAVGARLVYTSDQTTYNPEQLTARLGNGTILLQGGGNLGDLWPDHQRFREDVISTFRDVPIVQLPQTINFRRSEALARARAVFNSHPNLTLLVRDRQSLRVAQGAFEAPSLLCPDMAFALGGLSSTGPPRADVLWLCRSDQESAGAEWDRVVAPDERQDWSEQAAGFEVHLRAALRRWHRHRIVRKGAWIYTPHLYDVLARQRLAYGCRLLRRGKVVITDRLHGHILSILLGIPHILIDDRYSKVKRFYDTWTAPCTLTSWSESPRAALEMATASARGSTSQQDQTAPGLRARTGNGSARGG